ncbi:methyl-accepting chemotaxis protein [Rhodovulum sp. DZ06]|uniref:methyl-accepting chemotaxis protein n=1 Tax=Rhodovulum sp. DZ06 TaxID=3425126 RepID=UPI003D3353DF
MFSSVSAVIRLALAAVVATVLGIFAASEWGALQAERNAVEAEVAAERLVGPQVRLALTLKDLQINVIQVQQWLTDISATRGRDGLDDGFVAAEAQAQDFAKNAAEARRLAGGLGLAELADAVARVEDAFPAYYDAGRAMAKAYIADGADGGNRMMGGFDAAAERLHGALGEVAQINAAALARGGEGLVARLVAAEQSARFANLLVLGFGCLALLVSGVFAVVLTRAVARPLAAATAAARRLAAGDADSPIAIGARLRELRELDEGLNTFRAAAEVQLAASKAIENSLTPMMVVDAAGRAMVANPAFAKLWNGIDPAVRGGLAAGQGKVAELDFRPLVAAARKAEGVGAVRAKTGGRSAIELKVGARILELRLAYLPGDAGVVLEMEDVTGIRGLETDFLTAIEKVKAGEFDAKVQAVDDMGFTSTAARGFNTLCEAVARFISELSHALDAMAEGDLTARIPGGFAGRFAEAGDGFNRSISKLRDTVQEVASASEEVSLEARPISEGARDLASRTETEAAALEQMSATIAEFGGALKGAAARASEAEGLTDAASSGAALGAATVAETVTAVTRIEESSNNIRDIVNVIDGIAFQTNLLALNAAVEAARAGEAGKGFAVVASEVRQLAQRSADAAEEVRKLIEESSAHVGDGVRLVHRTGETLVELEGAVRSVAGTVGEISRSMRDQLDSVAQMAEAMQGLDSATQRNAALADQSASSADRLTQRAERLGALVSAFNLSGGDRGRAAVVAAE